MIFWKTQDGTKIPYSNLTDSHLINILRFIKRRSQEGVKVIYSYGYGDYDYPEGDVDFIYGADVLNRFNYVELKEEATRRGI